MPRPLAPFPTGQSLRQKPHEPHIVQYRACDAAPWRDLTELTFSDRTAARAWILRYAAEILKQQESQRT